MKSNNETTADQIENFLRTIISEASTLDPAPENYFMLFNPELNDHWILGFLFNSQENFRVALENGVCYQLHDYVSEFFSASKNLNDVKSYIVFDVGDLPKNNKEQNELHQKFSMQLDALHQEKNDDEFISCGLCGHGIDQHEMRGHTKENEPAPTEGWMICPNKQCTCFRTWSLGGDGTDA